VYDSGCDGLHVDREKLKCDIEQSLNGTYVGGNDNFSPVTAKVLRQERTKTLNEVKAGTRLLAQFSTSYDKDNVQRASNIARACAYIGGSVIKRGEEFSFNRTVGKRSRENGFFRAKVIEGGKYVEGFGGGVCQVSTTLYNAALLSGCTVTEYHPHSLSVGYTQPSRDAMVSWGYADMRFVNTTKSTIYIAMRAKNGQVVCSVYGESDGTEYGWESVITSTSDPPDEEKEGVWYTTAKQGLCSEGYLKVIKDGIEERVLIRRDSYAPLRVEGRRQQQNIAPQSEESP
jgi:vancomycin resistance protein YoaR